MPQQGGEQEGGRHGFVLAHPQVGLLQRQADKALAHWLLENHIQHRQQAVMQAFAT